MIYHDYLIEGHDYGDYWMYYVGKYGEDLMISKHPDGTYVFSSMVLDLWDIYLPEISKVRIVNSYCNKGITGFDIKADKGQRIENLGRALSGLYKAYHVNHDKEAYYLMWEILFDVEIFKLSRTHYIDWFITFGSSENWDYINYILKLRKVVFRSKIYHWKANTNYVVNGLRLSSIHAYAPAKKEAIKQILEDCPKSQIESIQMKELITDGRLLYQFFELNKKAPEWQDKYCYKTKGERKDGDASVES